MEVSDEDVTRLDRARKWLSDRTETFWIAWEDWRTKVGLSIVVLFVLVGTVGGSLVDVPTLSTHKWMPPFQSLQYPLGTNQYGKGILASLIHATPAMLLMVAGGAVFATVLGTSVGILSGYKGGRVDEALMTVTDIAMIIPGLPLIIVIASVYVPKNPVVVGILVSINAWAGGARSLRSQVLTIREESYVEASRIMNVSTGNILLRDVLPQLLPLVLINFVMAGRAVIFNAVGLYFLGVLPFSTTNWGVMLNLAYEAGAITTPSLLYTALFPLLVIVLFSWGLVMLAQGLDRVVNVRVRVEDAAAARSGGGAAEE